MKYKDVRFRKYSIHAEHNRYNIKYIFVKKGTILVKIPVHVEHSTRVCWQGEIGIRGGEQLLIKNKINFLPSILCCTWRQMQFCWYNKGCSKEVSYKDCFKQQCVQCNKSIPAHQTPTFSHRGSGNLLSWAEQPAGCHTLARARGHVLQTINIYLFSLSTPTALLLHLLTWLILRA